MVGTYDTQTPAEQWNKDLEDMWTNHEQTEREMYPENKEKSTLDGISLGGSFV